MLKKTLRWLIENVEEHTDHSFLEHYQDMMKKWEEKLHDQEEDSSIPIKPQRVMHALQQVAHDDAILSSRCRKCNSMDSKALPYDKSTIYHF